MYDNICKFIAENFKDDIASWLLGSPIKLTELSPTELSAEPIRADSLILLQSDDLVLHTEFQTAANENIPFRMLDYRIRVYRRFPQKEMRQVVVYLRKTGSTLVSENNFRLNNTYHQFEVVRLWEEPTEKFLSVTGLLPFAVLSRTNDARMVLSQVAQAVEAIADRQIQSNIAAASSVLAGLVLDNNVINQILRSDIMRESVVYQELLAEGEAKGEAKGKAEGKAEGKVEGKAEATRKFAANLLRMGMSLAQIAEATELTIEQVQALQNELQQSN